MSLSEITQKVLRLVETRSGIPVHVEPDPSLPATIPAKVVMARGTLALHRVLYRPDSSSLPDYLICAQAGSILRLFDTPPEKRFDFAAPDPRIESPCSGKISPCQRRCRALLFHRREAA